MSFFRYPGGKSKLKDKISKYLSDLAQNQKIQYREPFFGGGSIGLKLLEINKDIKNIWINDKDVGIACLWSSVIQYPESLKEYINNFEPSVEDFYSFKQELLLLKTFPILAKDMINIGFKKLAIHQTSYSGLGTKSGGPLGGEAQKSKYKIDCRWSPKYICKKIDKLHQRLSKITIKNDICTNLDFCNVIVDDTNEALIYLDPPYYVKGNDLYQHGFAKEDHVRLADLLKNTTHKWILSYDDCPEIRKLYYWAKFQTFDVNYTITAIKNKMTGERLSRTKSELLILP